MTTGDSAWSMKEVIEVLQSCMGLFKAQGQNIRTMRGDLDRIATDVESLRDKLNTLAAEHGEYVELLEGHLARLARLHGGVAPVDGGEEAAADGSEPAAKRTRTG